MDIQKLSSLEGKDALRYLLGKIRISNNLSIKQCAAQIGTTYLTLSPFLKRRDVTHGAKISDNILINIAHYVESNGYSVEDETDRRLEKAERLSNKN